MSTVFVYSVCIIASQREVARGESVVDANQAMGVSYECAPCFADGARENLTPVQGSTRAGRVIRATGGQCRLQLVE